MAAALCFLGCPDMDLCCAGSMAASDETETDAFKCAAGKFREAFEDTLPNDIHWVDLDDPVQLVAMVSHAGAPSVERGGFSTAPFDRVMSHMTYGDNFWNHAHQGTDWNWEFPTRNSVDPDYAIFGLRYESVREEVGGDKPGMGMGPWKLTFQWHSFENEMEYLVARGRWDSLGHASDELATHGMDLIEYLKQPDDVLNIEWLRFPTPLGH